MKFTLTTILTILSFSLFAQVPRTVVVEHFTNTRCGICANRNPGFNANLDNFPNVLRLTVHPSSPYSNCVFNQHNSTDNDGRTNYYGIYGGTPRIVVQGNVIPATQNYGDASLFQNETGQTTPFSIKVEVGDEMNGQVAVTTTVYTESMHTFNTLKLFTAIAEDTIYYNAPNGESVHYDVFRTSVFEVGGKDITPASMVGDSVTFSAMVNVSNDWDMDHIYALAFLQNASNKSVLQASSSKNPTSTNTEKYVVTPFQLYSAGNQIFFTPENTNNYQIQVFDLQGQLLRQINTSETKTITLENVGTKTHLIRVVNEDKVWTKLLPIVN
jgi:hypothetical protein